MRADVYRCTSLKTIHSFQVMLDTIQIYLITYKLAYKEALSTEQTIRPFNMIF